MRQRTGRWFNTSIATKLTAQAGLALLCLSLMAVVAIAHPSDDVGAALDRLKFQLLNQVAGVRAAEIVRLSGIDSGAHYIAFLTKLRKSSTEDVAYLDARHGMGPAFEREVPAAESAVGLV